jgi:hypothetical protein
VTWAAHHPSIGLNLRPLGAPPQKINASAWAGRVVRQAAAGRGLSLSHLIGREGALRQSVGRRFPSLFRTMPSRRIREHAKNELEVRDP